MGGTSGKKALSKVRSGFPGHCPAGLPAPGGALPGGPLSSVSTWAPSLPVSPVSLSGSILSCDPLTFLHLTLGSLAFMVPGSGRGCPHPISQLRTWPPGVAPSRVLQPVQRGMSCGCPRGLGVLGVREVSLWRFPEPCPVRWGPLQGHGAYPSPEIRWRQLPGTLESEPGEAPRGARAGGSVRLSRRVG